MRHARCWVALALRSQKGNKETLAVARISGARMHMRRLGFTCEQRNGIMVSPMGNFFTLHVITGEGPARSEEGEAREAKCLLCARRSSLIKSRWPNDESRAPVVGGRDRGDDGERGMDGDGSRPS